MRLTFRVLLICAIHTRIACSISWIIRSNDAQPVQTRNEGRIDWLGSHPSRPDVYTKALKDLQELESEPLCHRVAARLLVNNCQVLDGKDEAAVLTDNGQIVQDFIDAYGASLAICDLERGGFIIPKRCNKFREPTLARIPAHSQIGLHVSTDEINECLRDLGLSESMWSTWQSYRHKTFGFCQAARADNLKDRDIRLYQHLVKLMERLTTDVEGQLDDYLQSFDAALEKTTTALEQLEPQLNAVKSNVRDVDELISTRLFNVAQDHHDRLNRGLVDATTLQEMIALLVNTLAQNTEEIIASHGNALEVVAKQVHGVTRQVQGAAQHFNNENELIMATLAATMATTLSLQGELETSRLKAVEVGDRQDHMNIVLGQLEDRAKAIAAATEEHGHKLEAANKIANQIATTLDSAAASVTVFHSSFWSRVGLSGWWPFVYCPTASLLLGSYGLPPSLLRNVGLFGLGEAAAFLFSAIITPSDLPYSPQTPDALVEDDAKKIGEEHTSDLSSGIFSQLYELRRARYARKA